MKNTAVAPMPFCTPATMITITATHTASSGMSTPGRKSSPTPGSATCRKSVIRKVPGSSPHDWSMEKNV